MIVPYDESILASVAAIRSYLGLAASYPPDPRLVKVLRQRKPKQICLVLIGALGANQIARKLPKEAFLNRQLLYKTMTVFPSSTLAATTAVQSGLSPNLTAWLGKCEWVQEVKDEVLPFSGEGFYSGKSYGVDFFSKLFPVTFTDEELRQKGQKALCLLPDFTGNSYPSLHGMIDRLLYQVQQQAVSYLYAYWDHYTTLLHKYGVDSLEADRYLRQINQELEYLAQNLPPESLLIVVADHGQIDGKEEINLAHTELAPYFSQRPCIEARCMAFFIKPNKKEEFARHFKEKYSQHFMLLSQRQVITSKLFGFGDNHPRLSELIGDYLAIATGDAYFSYNPNVEKENKYIGVEAGIHKDELFVPVIVA